MFFNQMPPKNKLKQTPASQMPEISGKPKPIEPVKPVDLLGDKTVGSSLMKRKKEVLV